MNPLPEIVMVPLTEILQTVTGTCDFWSVETDDERTDLWLEIVRVKSADTGFGHLVESILEHGFAALWAVLSTIRNHFAITLNLPTQEAS